MNSAGLNCTNIVNRVSIYNDDGDMHSIFKK